VAGLGQAGTEVWGQTLVVSTAPNEVRSEALRLMAGRSLV
jgi:hypothetical protein